MTAATSPPTSPESFFALYWDHARYLPCLSLCLMAGFSSVEIADLAQSPWDELLEYQRARLRAALLKLLEIHDELRTEAERRRELHGEKVTA